jgi:hypothetical protein
MAAPRYDIRPFRPGDEDAILATFNAVFGENDPSFVPRTRAEWDWAFAHNPAGRRIWVAESEGVIAAQCAALPYRVHVDGRETTFTQGVDSMVHPEHRKGLRRPGLYVETAYPFFREFGGLGGDLLHYGWPVEPAWRIGRTFLGYEIVRTQPIHVRDLEPGPTEIPREVERVERFGDDVVALYDRCRAGWGASVIRDARYLNWRFLERPGFRYDVFAVRDSAGALAGCAIHRRADRPFAGSGLIMDWLVPDDEPEAGELLREACLARGRADGARASLVVFPEWTPWNARFQDWGYRVHTTDYLLIGIVQHPRYDTWWLRRNWWYQLAELDVV